MKVPGLIITVFLASSIFLSLFSCKSEEERMARGFRLPEGDAERGHAAFLQMKCHQCHTVAGVTLPASDTPSEVSLELGGVVRKVKTYGELVTSIIRPQHVTSPQHLEKLDQGKTPGTTAAMPSYNDTMTVTQMTDIVTFLHQHYQKAPPPGVDYPYYAP